MGLGFRSIPPRPGAEVDGAGGLGHRRGSRGGKGLGLDRVVGGFGLGAGGGAGLVGAAGRGLAGLAVEAAGGEPVDRGGGDDEADRAPQEGGFGRAAGGEAERGEIDRVADDSIPDIGGVRGRGEEVGPGGDLAHAKGAQRGAGGGIVLAERLRNAPRRQQLHRPERDREDAEAEAQAFVIHVGVPFGGVWGGNG